MEGEAVEAAMRAQPGEKIVVEHAGAGAAGLTPQEIDVLVACVCMPHPVQQPGQAGVDTIAGPVRAIIGIIAEIMVELDVPLVQARAIIELDHGELILVGEQEAFGGPLIGWSHRTTSAIDLVTPCCTDVPLPSAT